MVVQDGGTKWWFKMAIQNGDTGVTISQSIYYLNTRYKSAIC